MSAVRRTVEKIAASDTTVFICGESGTGKELVARAIHRLSKRAAGPFIKVNCGALTETLLESELFGHEKGAFTGAAERRLGRFELADGGTLFLDEIGEMEPDSQVKLLRAIETGTFSRVGGTRPRRVDVRLVAATNRDLAEAMKAGEFRQDLYYRINTITVHLPPLRERPDDVALLAKHFVESNATYGLKRLSAAALSALEAYAWPGNVRELLHAIERAVILSKGDEILPSDLPPEVLGSNAPPVPSAGGSLETMERQHIVAVLRQVSGHRGKAAALLAIDPKTLYRKINSYGIGAAEFR
jgi:DNA-binding NtrC family response regulator